MVANANPMSITYTWTKDGLPILASGNGVERIVSEGPILNITKLTRNDAGVYTCEAVNSQGSAMINITVIVECELIKLNDTSLYIYTHIYRDMYVDTKYFSKIIYSQKKKKMTNKKENRNIIE